MAATGVFSISTAAWANPLPGNLWFDEYGSGYYEGQRLQSSVVMDPTGGVSEPVLMYLLPSILQPTPGDVLLINPDGSGWSDVIRFAFLGPFVPDPHSSGKPVVIYYSNASDGPGVLPADVHSMPQLMPNSVTLPERGLYEPQVDEPGYVQTFAPLRYVFFGDQPSYNAPEGGMTALLLGVALAGTHFVRRVKAGNTLRRRSR